MLSLIYRIQMHRSEAAIGREMLKWFMWPWPRHFEI